MVNSSRSAGPASHSRDSHNNGCAPYFAGRRGSVVSGIQTAGGRKGGLSCRKAACCAEKTKRVCALGGGVNTSATTRTSGGCTPPQGQLVSSRQGSSVGDGVGPESDSEAASVWGPRCASVLATVCTGAETSCTRVSWLACDTCFIRAIAHGADIPLRASVRASRRWSTCRVMSGYRLHRENGIFNRGQQRVSQELGTANRSGATFEPRLAGRCPERSISAGVDENKRIYAVAK